MKTFEQFQQDLRESIRVVDTEPPLPVNGWRVTFLFDKEKAKEISFINAARKLKMNPNAIIKSSGKVEITVTIKKASSAVEAVLKAKRILPNLIETVIEVKSLDEADSFLKVYGVSNDEWIVDRFVKGNPRHRSGGRQGVPYKKKGQALKAAKKIARTTGEEVKIGRAWPKGGGPEVLRKKKS
ncbi:MAG: hypothetical protein QQN46_02090 [Nitrosopumilus sp.]